MLTDGPTPEEASYVAEHFTYLKRLTDEGIVLLAGRTLTMDEASFGIVLFRADAEPAAVNLMENDPAVRAGVMRATLYPFRIALQGGQ